METWKIKGHILEFDEDIHQYLVDGVCVPSITQIMKIKFGKKYAGVDSNILNKASQKGTEVHKAIESLCKYGEISNLKEVRNFIFLQDKYYFEVVDNEIPIILFDKNGEPIAGGRIDLILKEFEELGLGDIKRTSTLDKEYLAYQLNLYRIGYQQSYGKEIKFLRGIHLREEKRKFVEIPINEEKALELVKEWKENELLH